MRSVVAFIPLELFIIPIGCMYAHDIEQEYITTKAQKSETRLVFFWDVVASLRTPMSYLLNRVCF